MIPIGTDIDEAPPAALRKSFTKVEEEKRKKDQEALIAFVDTFRGYQVRIGGIKYMVCIWSEIYVIQRKINVPKKEFWQTHLDESVHYKVIVILS